MKDHGVYTQARCRLRGWELHESDLQRLQGNTDTECVLQHLPKRIFVEMEVKNYPKYEDLPANWVPIPPTNTNWNLDHAESIQIKRRGFALSPDFSSTIHSATGRTLVSCVPDLNPIEVAPNTQSAMEGYIALSRVEDAEGLIIAQHFAPTLFQQGPAPYPTLLPEVLKGQVSQVDLDKRLQELQATNTTKLLKKADFRCGSCDKDLPATSFIRPSQSSEAYVQSIISNILMSGACAVCMRCRVGIDEQMFFLRGSERDKPVRKTESLV